MSTKVMTQGARDVLAERQKQLDKGYTPAHDDQHTPSQIIRYGGLHWYGFSRDQLVRAAACIIAAIDRLDRT